MLSRIREACWGHLKWLHCVQKQNIGQCFGPNYWVTGKLMVKPKLSESWVANDSLLDTGFQILKAAAWTELRATNYTAAEFEAELMSHWAPSWLLSMEKSDKRKKYAWPHAEKEGVNTFRLDEHVWIWRVLKSLEQNNRRVWDKISDNSRNIQLAAPSHGQDVLTAPLAIQEDEVLRLRKVFRSEVVQHEVSKRFTTENSFLQKHMLATTRSMRESRFMLHSRDTSLVYREPFDFMEDNPVQKLWKATIQCQMYHTEYGETDWGKPLRYALYIMLGAQDYTIDNTPPDELVRTATGILLRSSSPNGLFPGRIEISTNKPVPASSIYEEDMESYYHASFEIPYIFLTHVQQVSAAYDRRKLAIRSFRRNSDPILGGSFIQQRSMSQNIGLDQGDAEQSKMRQHLSDLLLTLSDLDNNEIFRDIRRTTKKAVPFDQLVDSSNIVKLEDEWLYKYPDFLSININATLKIRNRDEGLEELERQLKPPGAGTVPKTSKKYVSAHIEV